MLHNSVAGGTVGDLFPKAQLSLPMGGFYSWSHSVRSAADMMQLSTQPLLSLAVTKPALPA
jgi:hypothetical protein